MEAKIKKYTESGIYNGIFTKSPIGMAICNNEGGIVETNRALQEMLGYSSEEFKTLSFQDVTHPDDLETDVSLFTQLVAGEIQDYQIEKRYYTKERKLKWGSLSVTLLWDKAGKVEHVIGMVKDITAEREKSEEIKKLNRELELALKRNATAHSIAEFGYYETDILKNSWTGSAEFYDLFGFDPDSAPFTMENFAAIVHPEDITETMMTFEKAMNEGQAFDHEYRCVHQKTGEVIHVQSRSVFEYKNGKPVKVYGIKYVITKQKELENRLRLANERLNEFTHTITHDLKEPIRSISGIIGLIEKEADVEFSDTIKKYFSMVKTASRNLGHMIGELLEYSRLGSREKTLQSISLKDCLDKMKLLLHNLILSNDAKFVFDAEDLTLKVYPEHFYSLLQNLISNAIKYRGDATPVITISHSETTSHYWIKVSDNGTGIEPRYQQAVFKLFHRAGKKKTETSSGIGLYLCQQMAELHEGTIMIEKSDSNGTTMAFSISRHLR